MTVAELAASTLVVTQFLKNFLDKLKIKVEGVGAVILSVLVSIGVVLFSYVQNGQALNFGMIVLIVQVIIASNAGYSLIKVARNKE
jgi:ABC-type Mn2+/Zn2+ transport system permease subunit